MNAWPITIDDARAARERLGPFLKPTPFLDLPGLAGGVLVKLENRQPTKSFKVRNALSVLTALAPEERRRGVVAASRGNHGQGLAWAGQRLGVPVTICVPAGNSVVKNEAMWNLGATLVEEGRDYDEAVAVADRLVRERGMRLVHSTNEPLVIAGAATMALEMLEEAPGLEALVIAVGGGSQAVGAMTVARALKPGLAVYGVQAAGASAIHDSWHAGRALSRPSADTFADGLATRNTYDLTFGALRKGLAGFVTVTDGEIGEALRALYRVTGEAPEGAGAAGLAGLMKLRDALAGKSVGIVFSGANIDPPLLERILSSR